MSPGDLQGQSSGPSTDRHNEPVIDPTKNVLDLVAAETRRQDDLRIAEARRVDEQLRLRGEQRAHDLSHVTAIVALRAEYEDKLRAAETSRIDAIRQVDVGNVQRAAEVQAGVAAALEAKVATTALAFESRLTATIEPIQRRIDDLTRTQYEQQGQKLQVVEQQGASASSGMWIGVVVASVVGIAGVIGLIWGITQG